MTVDLEQPGPHDGRTFAQAYLGFPAVISTGQMPADWAEQDRRPALSPLLAFQVVRDLNSRAAWFAQHPVLRQVARLVGMQPDLLMIDSAGMRFYERHGHAAVAVTGQGTWVCRGCGQGGQIDGQVESRQHGPVSVPCA